MADGEPARPGGSEYVSWVQDTLNSALGMSLAVDGVMTGSLRRWIRVFQRQNRLPVSGFIGPDTEAALRRVRRDGEQREFEFEWELSGAALTAENALAASKAVPVESALKTLKSLGKDKIAGLYRFHTSTGKFYTGKAVDLRRRIIQHMWCLSHFGKTTRGMRLALYIMKDTPEAQVRALEKKINEHHKDNGNRLNKVTELEVLELNEI
jgi:predicted GIY-YIG superfamily endonuclease